MTEIAFTPYDCQEPYRSRLLKHALYLRGETGPLRAEFTMDQFDQWGNSIGATECGTVGCSLGHAPYSTGVLKLTDETWYAYGERVFGILDWPSDTFSWNWLFSASWETTDETWYAYGERVFGILDWPSDTFSWNWLFSASWETTDNTPEGAAARIYVLLNHGLPSNSDKQISGEAPLCYRKDIILTSSREDLEKGRHLLALA